MTKYRIVLHRQGYIDDVSPFPLYTIQKETTTGWKFIKHNYKDSEFYPYDLTVSFSEAAKWKPTEECSIKSMKEFVETLKSVCEIDRELEKRSKWSFSVEQEFEL